MRHLSLLLLVMLLTLPLGCGNTENSSGTTSKIEVWLDASPELLPLLREQVKPLTDARTPVKVNFRVFRFEDLKPAILGCKANDLDDKPDLIMVSSDWMGELVNSGLLQPLPEISTGYVSVASAAMHWENKCYGVPWSLDVVAMIVNSDLVKSVPGNFKQLLELGDILPDKIYPLVYDNKNFYYHAAWYHAFGAKLFNDGQLEISSDVAAKSLDFAYDLENRFALVPAKSNQSAAINLFAAGQAAVTINGPWAIGSFIKNGVNFEVVPIPGPETGEVARPLVGVKGIGITSYCRRKESAQQVLDMITSEKFMRKIAAKSLFIPCFKLSGETSGWMQGFVDQASRGILMPSRPEMKFFWSEINRAMRLRFAQASSSKELLLEAEERILKAIAREAAK